MCLYLSRGVLKNLSTRPGLGWWGLVLMLVYYHGISLIYSLHVMVPTSAYTKEVSFSSKSRLCYFSHL